MNRRVPAYPPKMTISVYTTQQACPHLGEGALTCPSITCTGFQRREVCFSIPLNELIIVMKLTANSFYRIIF